MRNFIINDTGTTAIEYGLIGFFIAVVIVSAVTAVGLKVVGLFTAVSDAF